MTLLRRAWAAPLWAHAAALAVLLLALLPLMSPQSSFTEDEGAYALQAKALADGGWEYDYKAASVDPAGTWFPVTQSERSGDRFYTYIQHPAYPLLLRAGVGVAGTAVGLHLFGLLGAVGAAVAAWLLAGEVDPALRRPSFWLVAASPVLVNGFLLWAHAPSAAAAGFALVAAARVARRGLTPLATAAVTAALVVGIFLRSEGLLFAGGVAGALAVIRYRRAGLAQGLLALGVLGVPAAVAALVERRWIESIVGGSFDNLTVRGGTKSTSYLVGRVAGAFHTLVQAHDSSAVAGLPVLVAAGLTVGLGWMALRRWRPTSRRDLTIAVVGVVVLLGVRAVQHPTESVTGLVAAWPVAALGLLLLPRDRDPVLRLCLGAAGLFGGAVLLTQYSGGGGLEWGGRFFSPAIVPLAVVAVAGFAARLRAVPAPARPMATAAVAGLALAAAGFGLVVVGATRADQDRLIAAAARHPATVTVTTVAAYPRIAWRTHDHLSWMLTDDAGLPGLLATLRARNVPDVVVVTAADTPAAAFAAYGGGRPAHEPVFDGLGATMVLLGTAK